MPSNAEFSFSVLVGGHAIPEYRAGAEIFVESNLYTPASYKEKEEVIVDGQTEVNEWPVTPYTIEITTAPLAPLARYTVSVDGFAVTKITMTGGQSRVVKGFHDDERGGIAGFVFSLPRYAKNKKDRGKQNVENVGTIRVESYDTWQKWLHQPTLVTRGRKSTVFVPATKRDTLAVTSGQYTMVTTRLGRNIPTPARGASFLRRFRWATGVRRGALEVKCRTEDAVRAMGFQIQPYPVVIATNNNISAGNNIVIATNNVSATKNNVSATNNSISAGNNSVLASNNNVSAGNSSTGVVLSNNDKVPAASISTEGKQPPEVLPCPVVSSNNNINNMEGPSTASICGPEIPPCSVVLFNDNNEARGVSTTSSSSKVEGSIVDGREVRPNNHSCENTAANPAQETKTFNGIQAGPSNVRVENGKCSRKVQLAEDIAASEDAKSKPVEPSVAIKPATIEMETVPPCRNEELVAMETASCSSIREVKAEDLVKKTEKDPELKQKVKLLQPELIDLTADDGPEVVDLTTDNYLPEVYEVKFTTKIEVVHLEEAENDDTAVPMQT